MTSNTLILSGSAAALALWLGALAGPARAQPAQASGGLLPCTVAGIQAAAPADTTIEKVEHLDAPVSHCRVDGYVTATNPGPNKDYFRLQLPDKNLWKGRFYFIGLGGAAGYVPTDSQIPAGNPMVKGFAVAGTDTGHEAPILDWKFLNDPVKTLDHRDRAAHLTTVAAQQITKAYYGVDKMYRYETGCSGGGRMGGEAAARHPGDYDGILLGEMSGISYNPTIEFSNYKFILAAQAMNREPGSWLSPAKLKMAEAHVTAACDDTDGAHDGVVWDWRLCHYDFNQLKCKAGDAPDCLTQPEITSIYQILDGPRGADGKRFSVGWPITNMSTWSTFLGSSPPPWVRSAAREDAGKTSSGYVIAYTRGSGFFGLDFDPLKFNLKDPKAIAEWERLSAAQQFQGRPDLTQAEKTGDKVLLWGGVSSPCCSNVEMEDYVDHVRHDLGPDRASKFLALYEFPGMGHCGGGTGPGDAADRLLDTLIDWVENGEAPGPVVAHRGADRERFQFISSAPVGPGESGVVLPQPSGVSRDFKVCPYPEISVFDTSKADVPGAVYEAANWSCQPARRS